MLDYFEVVTLNSPNDELPELFAKVGDKSSRGVRVVTPYPKGVIAQFLWSDIHFRRSGVLDFEEVSDGIFELVYPFEILKSGLYDVCIQFKQADDTIGSKNTHLTVQGLPYQAGIDDSDENITKDYLDQYYIERKPGSVLTENIADKAVTPEKLSESYVSVKNFDETVSDLSIKSKPPVFHLDPDGNLYADYPQII